MNSSTSTSEPVARRWWLLPLLCALLLPGYNWVQDYYGIFGHRSDWRGVIPNERYRKYEAVLSRRDEITALLFGSSKAANIPFTENLGPGAYNFAYSEGLPRDHLEVLTVLVDELPALRQVYIAVDEMAYLLDPGRHAEDYLRRHHPAVAGIARWRFGLDYLFRPLSNTDVLYFSPQRQQRPVVSYAFDTSGRSLCPQCDAEIDADPDAHRQQPFFRFPYNPPDQYGLLRLRDDLTAILALLESRGIEAVLFLQPTYLNNLRWHNLGMLEALKAMLAELAPFHDFLVAEAALGDTLNFYDVIHFRPQIGQRMMEHLAGTPAAEPGGFGYRVGEGTLPAHNAAIREDLLNTWVTPAKYRRDREYSRWQVEHDFPRGPLPNAPAAELLIAPAAEIDCRVDTVNRGRFLGRPVRVAVQDLGMLEFAGWGKLTAAASTGYLLVREQVPLGIERVYPFAAGIQRKDVARRFGPAFEQVGFRGNLDLAGLRRGTYRLDWRLQSGSAWFQCGESASLVVN